MQPQPVQHQQPISHLQPPPPPPAHLLLPSPQPNSTNQLHQNQNQNQQQQVPMTTIMIPATAASQLQSASLQIQQAAQAAMAAAGPQILVFMIPYSSTGSMPVPAVSQPPTIPATPDQPGSLNSTLVRHSIANSSTMTSSSSPHQPLAHHFQQLSLQPQLLANSSSQQHLSSHPANQNSHSNQPVMSLNPPAPPPMQTQQQLAASTGNLHHRAVSSLSVNGKPEAERFYVKANFSYSAARNKMELTFQKGDILHVLDTLQNSEYSVQCWLASHVNPNTGKDSDKGLIPDKGKAEEIAANQRAIYMSNADLAYNNSSTSNSNTFNRNSSGQLAKVSFLKRRVAQRSKSLCEDNWDNVVFDIGSFKLPAYERVVYKHPGFSRPVVIFGPLADVARKKLLRDYPEKYSYPAGFNQSKEHPKVIRLKGILEVIDQGKHALLDITPSAVEKLNFVNLAPIVIFMKTDSKSIIMEFRSRAAKSLEPNARDEDILRHDGKSSRKLLEQSIKLEKTWSHVFTATLNLSTMGSEMWYRKLRETIENQQSANVWMGEKKSEQKSKSINQNVNNHNHIATNGNNPNNPNFLNNNWHNSHSTSTLPHVGHLGSSQSIISGGGGNQASHGSELNLISAVQNGPGNQARGSAFQLYSDINQTNNNNNYYYYDLNKI